MNRRTWMKMLLAIPGVALIAKAWSNTPAPLPSIPLPEGKANLPSECFQLMNEVLQYFGEKYLDECHWETGMAFRATWYMAGVVIAQGPIGLALKPSADFGIANLGATVVRAQTETGYDSINNSARLFHGNEFLGIVYCKPLTGFDNQIDTPIRH